MSERTSAISAMGGLVVGWLAVRAAPDWSIWTPSPITTTAEQVAHTRHGRSTRSRTAVLSIGRPAGARCTPCRASSCPDRERRVRVSGGDRPGPGGPRCDSAARAWCACTRWPGRSERSGQFPGPAAPSDRFVPVPGPRRDVLGAAHGALAFSTSASSSCPRGGARGAEWVHQSTRAASDPQTSRWQRRCDDARQAVAMAPEAQAGGRGPSLGVRSAGESRAAPAVRAAA
jgi:hypothetical protein